MHFQRTIHSTRTGKKKNMKKLSSPSHPLQKVIPNFSPVRDFEVRVTQNGTLKSIQADNEFLGFLRKNPSATRDFLKNYTELKLAGKVATKTFFARLFDPKDKSSNHALLCVVNFKGKKYFVKEVRDPVFPHDALSQFLLHGHIAQAQHELAAFGVRVIQYRMATHLKKRSFLVGDFEEGIMLEDWLKKDSARLANPVFKRFLKAERLLRKHYSAKDITTRNAIYNEKTNTITIIDLNQA